MYKDKKILALIPARGGSKGLLRKNIIEFSGRPLIYWTLDAARGVLDDECICVSSDDDEIIRKVVEYGISVPFKRPQYLATDTSSANDVIIHALTYYQDLGMNFDLVLLLQPTSPLRNSKHLLEALELYDNDVEMIVSVKESDSPATLAKENINGFLELYINNNGERRQELGRYYEYNGAIYLINVPALLKKGLHQLTHVRKYVMSAIESVDIDDLDDLKLAEFYKQEYKL